MKTNFNPLFILAITALLLMGFSRALINESYAPQDRWLAPASAKNVKNPFSGKSSINKGKAIYKMRCIMCHGENGKGDTPAGRALKPPAADHSSELVQKQTDGEIFWKISEGRGPMVSWKLILSEEERWNVVNYIRTLKSY